MTSAQVSTPDVPARAADDQAARQHLLAALAVVPILATVYQTIVLTDVTGDVIRKGIEGDSYQMIWTNLAWGVATLYGIFLGMWAMARLGQRLTLCAGLVAFALGNLLCGLAVDVPSMCAARLVEGIGKGATVVICRSLLYRQFDKQVMVAIGFYGVAAYSTRHATPLVTAIVNDALSWRWIYWVNVPIALLGLALVRRFIRPDRPSKPILLRIDWIAVTLLSAWVACLLFAFGWYRKWGGWTSDEFAGLAILAAVLPVILIAKVASGTTPDEHLRRLVRVRVYVLAMCVRTLMLIYFSAVLAIMAKYLIELRDYPRDLAGLLMAAAMPTMAASTLLTLRPADRRSQRHLWLLVGMVGCAGCLWWMGTIDNFTPKERIAAMFAGWGFFLGMLPPVFLTDEVESLERKDAVYGGSLGMVCLITCLLIVPVVTSTLISEVIDRAVDAQRLNLREERVAVQEAQVNVSDYYRQRGVQGPELSSLTGTALGASVKAESVARGFQEGLRFLSLVMLGFGLLVGVALWGSSDVRGRREE